MNMMREARLRRDLNNVAGQVESLLSALGDEGSERLQGMRDRLGSVASNLGASARDKFSNLDSSVRGGARQAARYTDEYVHHNPWQAIGLVALTSLVIGYLASRR